MAFNLSVCPTGGSSYNSANGRVIIGIGTKGSYIYNLGNGSFQRLTSDDGYSYAGISDSTYQGGNSSHENRPPYIALKYCKKD